MNVFVSEYVCGGGWPEDDVPPSLLREGGAMLRAIVEDLSRVPNCHVVTTMDAGRQPLSAGGVRVVQVRSPQEEQDVFAKLAAESDFCLVIAPELDNILNERCEAARRAGAGRLLNPASNLVRLCSDKLRLFAFLQTQQIPTIPTVLWTHATASKIDWAPIVIKPRFGAGSQGVQTHESAASARRAVPPTCGDGYESVEDGWIAQPLIPGTAVSVGVLCDQNSGATDILPVATQTLSSDGRFRYLGGRIPYERHGADEVRTIVAQACHTLEDMSGYVGFDLIVPLGRSEQPVLVEINPRLTTSYLGYRHLAIDNLAARLLGSDIPVTSALWQPGNVVFLPDGRFDRNVG